MPWKLLNCMDQPNTLQREGLTKFVMDDYTFYLHLELAPIEGKELSGRSTVKKNAWLWRESWGHEGDAAEKEGEHSIYLFSEYLLVSNVLSPGDTTALQRAKHHACNLALPNVKFIHVYWVTVKCQHCSWSWRHSSEQRTICGERQ